MGDASDWTIACFGNDVAAADTGDTAKKEAESAMAAANAVASIGLIIGDVSFVKVRTCLTPKTHNCSMAFSGDRVQQGGMNMPRCNSASLAEEERALQHSPEIEAPDLGQRRDFGSGLVIGQRLEHVLSVGCQRVRLVRFHEAHTHGLGDGRHVRRQAPDTVVDRRQCEVIIRPSDAGRCPAVVRCR